MREAVEQILWTHYGLRAQDCVQVTGGWSAEAFAARTADARYFVKVYDKSRPSTRPWVDRIPLYMPVVRWLNAHTALGGYMAVPIDTKDGAYQVELGDAIYIVFPYIEGETLAEKPLSPAQTTQLARHLAVLHTYGAEIPVDTRAMVEDFSLPFADSLAGMLRADEGTGELAQTLSQYRQVLDVSLAHVRDVSKTLRAGGPAMALCHTDVHGWNLMQSGQNLMLLDWEGLRLAPVEADLFCFTEGFFFGDAWEAFLAAYSHARGGYAVHADAMVFYRLRRRLEDIEAFADSILHDGLPPQEVQRSLLYLRKECEALATTP